MRPNQVKGTQETAIALGYQAGLDSAPRVVAKGKGFIAHKIIEIAQRHRIPLHFNPELSKMLYSVSLNEMIPVHLYEIVAGVLAWVYSIDTAAKGAERSR